jgi:hypothetical protein
VSCVSVSMLGQFHKYRYPSFYELLLQWRAYIRKIFYFWKRTSTELGVVGEQQKPRPTWTPPPSQSRSTCLVLIIQNQLCSRSINICVICAQPGSLTAETGFRI